jgi:hypothetical protein
VVATRREMNARGNQRTSRDVAIASVLVGVGAAILTVGVMAFLAVGLFTSPFGLALATGAAVIVGVVAALVCYLVMTTNR